jgi:hypothetical protein
MLSPGSIKFGLAMIGVVFGLKAADSRRWSLFLLVLAVLAFLLSLGPNLRVLGWQPWWALVEYVPLFADVRSVLRFAFFVHMIVVVFAALGLNRLDDTCTGRLQHRRWRVVARSVLVLLAVTALLEVRVRPGVYARVPDVKQHNVWANYVREHTPAGHAVACIPFAPGDRVEDFQGTAEWMYLGTFHGVPLVNGYSSHFPRSYYVIRHELTTGFPSEDKLQRLVDMNVKFLLLRRPVAENYVATNYNASLGDYWIKHVCADELVDVFEVGRTSR